MKTAPLYKQLEEINRNIELHQTKQQTARLEMENITSRKVNLADRISRLEIELEEMQSLKHGLVSSQISKRADLTIAASALSRLASLTQQSVRNKEKYKNDLAKAERDLFQSQRELRAAQSSKENETNKLRVIEDKLVRHNESYTMAIRDKESCNGELEFYQQELADCQSKCENLNLLKQVLQRKLNLFEKDLTFYREVYPKAKAEVEKLSMDLDFHYHELEDCRLLYAQEMQKKHHIAQRLESCEKTSNAHRVSLDKAFKDIEVQKAILVTATKEIETAQGFYSSAIARQQSINPEHYYYNVTVEVKKKPKFLGIKLDPYYRYHSERRFDQSKYDSVRTAAAQEVEKYRKSIEVGNTKKEQTLRNITQLESLASSLEAEIGNEQAKKSSILVEIRSVEETMSIYKAYIDDGFYKTKAIIDRKILESQGVADAAERYINFGYHHFKSQTTLSLKETETTMRMYQSYIDSGYRQDTANITTRLQRIEEIIRASRDYIDSGYEREKAVALSASQVLQERVNLLTSNTEGHITLKNQCVTQIRQTESELTRLEREKQEHIRQKQQLTTEIDSLARNIASKQELAIQLDREKTALNAELTEILAQERSATEKLSEASRLLAAELAKKTALLEAIEAETVVETTTVSTEEDMQLLADLSISESLLTDSITLI